MGVRPFKRSFAQIFEELTAYDQYYIKFNVRNVGYKCIRCQDRRSFRTWLHKNARCPRCFFYWRWNFAHVLSVPLPSPLRMGFFLFFLFALEKMWDPSKPKYHKKKSQYPNITKNTSAGSYLSTTAWAFDSEAIRCFMLEPACTGNRCAGPLVLHVEQYPRQGMIIQYTCLINDSAITKLLVMWRHIARRAEVWRNSAERFC